MVGAQHRIKRAILLHGEGFTVDSSPHVGVVGLLGQAGRYVTEGAEESAGRPIYAFFVPIDDSTHETDLIEYAGMTLSILAIATRRLRGVDLFRVIVAH